MRGGEGGGGKHLIHLEKYMNTGDVFNNASVRSSIECFFTECKRSPRRM